MPLIRSRDTVEQHRFNSAIFFWKQKNYFLNSENSTSCGLGAHQKLSASDNVCLRHCFGIFVTPASMEHGHVGCRRLWRWPGESKGWIS